MKILFLHGWHSVTGGVKPTYLASCGHTVVNPRLDDDDFESAVLTAQSEFQTHRPDVIVGSSRGGAIAMNIDSQTAPLILLCPAWKRWGTSHRLKPGSVILHSRNDDIIPFEDSEELIRNSELPSESLIETGSDHRLADEQTLAVVEWLCRLLASGKHLPQIDTVDANPNPVPSYTEQDTTYLCDGCGEEIVIPLDLSEGSHQSYVEDCPVCCRANLIHIDIDSQGRITTWAEPEQDRE